MILERCKDQTSATLDGFYARIAAYDDPAECETGQGTLDLIARLRRLEHPARAWGLTSHSRLCLLAQDNAASPWYVVIAVFGRDSYVVEYLMPESLAPWPRAYVRGYARSEDAAVEMIRTAIARSGGWSDAQTR